MERTWGADLIPCPRCMGASEYIPSPGPGEYPRSKCFAGHEHSLTPEVEKTLREIVKRAERHRRLNQ